MKDWTKIAEIPQQKIYPELKPEGYRRDFIHKITGESITCIVIKAYGHERNYMVSFGNPYLLGSMSIFCDSDEEFMEKFKMVFPNIKFQCVSTGTEPVL